MFKNILNSLSQHDSPQIITVSNYDYREITLNWVCALNKLNINNYLVVSLDQKVHDYFNQKNINSALIETENKVGVILKFKLQLSIYLLKNGIDFIFSDTDAVWLKNPNDIFLNEKNESDLVITMGTTHPKKVYNKWGFVMCTGLFFVKSSNKTIDLFSSALEVCDTLYRDDQYAVNIALGELGVEWKFEDQYNLYLKNKGLLGYFKRIKIKCSKSIVRGISNNLKISVLPYHNFPRTYSKKFDSYVLHPHAKKNSIDKKTLFKSLSIWMIDD